MKPLTAAAGLTAACIACCAIPLAIPTLLGVAGVASASFGNTSVALITGALAVSLSALAVWQRAKKRAVNARCGCGQGACETRNRP